MSFALDVSDISATISGNLSACLAVVASFTYRGKSYVNEKLAVNIYVHDGKIRRYEAFRRSWPETLASLIKTEAYSVIDAIEPGELGRIIADGASSGNASRLEFRDRDDRNDLNEIERLKRSILERGKMVDDKNASDTKAALAIISAVEESCRPLRAATPMS